jgi:hypothetical protein
MIKRSTNAQLSDVINSRKQDEEEENILLKQEMKAKARLRRTKLYGFGARAMIPKIKKNNSPDWSPFTIAAAASDVTKPKPIENSIPPGAHSDVYKCVT